MIWMLSASSWLDSQKAAETRQNPLAEYCHSLINQPPHISRCLLVCNFFAVRPEDENPPAPNTSVSTSGRPSLVEAFIIEACLSLLLLLLLLFSLIYIIRSLRLGAKMNGLNIFHVELGSANEKETTTITQNSLALWVDI